jgi:hypothetical protein
VKRNLATAHAEGRLVDRSLALVVLTLLLLTPPLLGIFDQPVLLRGIPLLYIFCYGVWLIAIVCGAWLALRLSPRKDSAAREAGSSERG